MFKISKLRGEYCSPYLEEITIRVENNILQGSGSPDAPSTVGFESIGNDEDEFIW